ncbi:hypothetical protein [Halioxenophilus aromaticivorans]|uniref:Lipoprotein n=1 Tax=Halioxenophilus aromaticivorans TaxID=1306992 RepID=A0AAV3U5P8_9ALTE
MKDLIFSTLLLSACGGGYRVTGLAGSDEACVLLQNDQVVKIELNGTCVCVVASNGGRATRSIDGESIAILLGGKK